MSIFYNKSAIITGGAAGMGRALADELCQRGAKVIIVDIDNSAVNKTVAELKKQGGSIQGFTLNVTEADAVKHLIQTISETYGTLDYLFNNAGIAIGGDARDLSLEQWQKVLDVNLNGVLYGTIAAYKHMAKQGSGHIINTASAT